MIVFMSLSSMTRCPVQLLPRFETLQDADWVRQDWDFAGAPPTLLLNDLLAWPGQGNLWFCIGMALVIVSGVLQCSHSGHHNRKWLS